MVSVVAGPGKAGPRDFCRRPANRIPSSPPAVRIQTKKSDLILRFEFSFLGGDDKMGRDV